MHFLVLEKDSQQPLGKSQVELLVGRQDFQDLMLGGAMKLWYRNINPSIIGYGTVNAIPNLSPGKYTQISNPNAKVELELGYDAENRLVRAVKTSYQARHSAQYIYDAFSRRIAKRVTELLGIEEEA